MLTHPSARSLRVDTPLSTESTCSHAHQHGVYVFTHPSARSLRVHTPLSTEYTCSHTPQHGVYVFTHPLARSLRVDLPLSTESTCILGYIYYNTFTVQMFLQYNFTIICLRISTLAFNMQYNFSRVETFKF